MDKKLYLRRNVVAEPLIDNWYAWAHLIPPVNYSMNLVNRHIRIMNSYIKNPKIHYAAAKNPAMSGGPFVDYQKERVKEIQRLLNSTSDAQGVWIELEKSVKDLNKLIKENAKGNSLEPLYESIPDNLRGYVELVYDVNNQPSFRFFESLMYKSELYDESNQSLMLSIISEDDRPFVLSTPRLQREDDVHLNMPFSSPNVDKLFESTRVSRTVDEIKELFQMDEIESSILERFWSDEPPSAYGDYTGGGVRWRYFGHACILIETKDVSILLDPILSYTYESNISRYTYEDLPEKIDYVLITHNHQDHILFETMLQIRHKVGNVIVPKSAGGTLQDPSLKLILENIGFDNVVEIGDMEVLDINSGTVTAIPFLGEHGDLDIKSKAAYLVNVGNHSLFFAADACNIDPVLYHRVQRVVGNVDVLFLGMECDGAPLSWIYGALMPEKLQHKMDQERRLRGSDYNRGMDLVKAFDFKEVYVYAMGQEPWLRYISSMIYNDESNPIVASKKLIEECNSDGVIAESLFGEKEILLK